MHYCKKVLTLFFFATVLFFLSNDVSAAPASKAEKAVKTGAIAGKIMIKGASALAGGQVMFYDAAAGPPPSPDKYERIPDISRDIDPDGNFIVELKAGKYYMGAVKRLSGDRMGPPQEGDLVFRSLDSKGKPKEYIIKAGSFMNIGTAEAVPLSAKDIVKTAVTTALEGTIVDMGDNPVAGAVVIAFTSPSMSGKPLFVSEKSDKKGRYVLPLKAGTYYLRVRNSFASGPPQPGQIVGYYGEGAPAPIAVKEGEIRKQIDFKVIEFPGRGPFSGTVPERQ